MLQAINQFIWDFQVIVTLTRVVMVAHVVKLMASLIVIVPQELW